MASFKVNISDPKTSRTLKTELTNQKADLLIGKKIGDTIRGEIFGMPNYEMVITGGSDFAGFPMVNAIPGAIRKRILTSYGIGMRLKAKGFRRRKTVVGNTISDSIIQINLKITKYGKKPLFTDGTAKPKQEKQSKQPANNSQPIKGDMATTDKTQKNQTTENNKSQK